MFWKKKKNRDSEGSESHDNSFRSSSSPKRILYGYYANIKKKDLLSYLYAKATSSLVVDETYFAIIPFEEGFLWELQEGGSGKSALKSVKGLLNEHDEIVIKGSEQGVKIVRNYSRETLDCFALSENDKSEQTYGVDFREKMKPVKSKGYGLYRFGLINLILSIFGLFLSVLFKYVIFNQSVEVTIDENKIEPPLTQIQSLRNYIGDPNSRIYVKSLNLSGTEWRIQTAVVQKEKEESEPSLDELESKIALDESENEPNEVQLSDAQKKAALENTIKNDGAEE